MNPRHAAALALVGWYLMFPPPSIVSLDMSGITPKNMNTELPKRVKAYIDSVKVLPLSFWETRAVYDSAQECKERKRSDQSAANSPEYADVEKCIASDDPRLKGN